MGVGTLISVDEYLHTSYTPDWEYRDGVLLERQGGDLSHSRMQVRLAACLGTNRKEWHIDVYLGLRIRVREGWYAVPDVCAYSRAAPEEDYPSRMPLLWVEILSPDDRIIDVWERTRQLVACGSPYVWIIDPYSLDSELRTSAGPIAVKDKTLRLPDSPIVVPLAEVMEE
jgi:Uma2 family endonuclease